MSILQMPALSLKLYSQLDLRKLTGQEYDGAATFSRKMEFISEFRPPLLM